MTDTHAVEAWLGREESIADTMPAFPATALAAVRFWRCITPEATLLFRYSALTFNSHRIHYDLPYATAVEGYPGLVVHGPLIATLLVDLARREVPGLEVIAFQFKAVHPLFDLHPFTVCGRPESPSRLRLWARDHEGRLAMDATLEHTT